MYYRLEWVINNNKRGREEVSGGGGGVGQGKMD